MGFSYLIIAKTFVPNKIRSHASDTPGSPASNYLRLSSKSLMPEVSHSTFLLDAGFSMLFYFLWSKQYQAVQMCAWSKPLFIK